MKGYLINGNKEECFGCRACEQICPKRCIQMIEDSEGFLYPSIIKSECIKCNLCIKVCPKNINKEINNSEIKSYVAWNKNLRVRKESSSGGIFSLLANNVLDKNGIVSGATLDNNMNVKHIIISSDKEIYKLRGSKYVQSDLGEIYSEIKEKLENGKIVLFSGTPCQVAGLKSFLSLFKKVDLKRLYLVDILCHGVPSSKIFNKYIKFIEKDNKSKVVDFKFRSKNFNGWSLSVIYEKNKKLNRKKIIPMLSPYYYGFQINILHRPSCYKCDYCTYDREGDITLGDYWGVKKFHSNIKSRLGVSAVIVNTQKGENIFDEISQYIEFEKSKIEYIGEYNKNLIESSEKHILRDELYQNIDQLSFEEICEKYLNPKYKIKFWIKDKIPYEIKDKFR